MIMNALNSVWSDIYILQIIIKKQLKKCERELDFKDIEFPVSIRKIHKIGK